MLPSERIIKKYDTYLELLKFAIKHDDDPEFKDLSLVNSYIQVLNEIEDNLDELFNEKVRNKNSLELDEILFSIFVDDFEEYRKPIDKQAVENKVEEFKKFIDTEEKKELISYFEMVMNLTDKATDRLEEDEKEGGLWWLEKIDKELNKITACFRPILSAIKKKKI